MDINTEHFPEQQPPQAIHTMEALKDAVDRLKSEIGQVIIGQEKNIDLIIVALLAHGHVLLEGVPGVAKTLTANLISKTIETGFSRIQFTPDLMPTDVTGTSIFNNKTSEFEFKKGPIFSNIVLIDEINRSPAKTQASLFEVMQEQQVTVDGTTYALDFPFLVIATQNPVEQEGTYHLPEAQLDRFMFKIKVDYPTLEQEIELLKKKNILKGQDELTKIRPILTPAELQGYQNAIHSIKIDETLLKYIAQIVNQTRGNSSLYLGASPRASIALLNGSKCLAAIKGRHFVTPDDIKFLAPWVLNHRIVLAPEKEIEGITKDDVVQDIINGVEIPR